MDIRPIDILNKYSFCFINPPILDYALYDLFAKPLGMLKTIKILKSLGAYVFYLDALDKNLDSSFFETGAIKPSRRLNGTGKYWKKRVEPLEKLKFYSREFYRFGLGFNKIIEILKKQRKFDFIIISSVFTYHYISVKILAEVLKENFPDTKLILAGIYPKLMYEHASKLGFDYVFNGDVPDFISFILNLFEININYLDILYNDDYVFLDKDVCEFIPDWDIINELEYGIIRLTNGCPYKCPYCASKIISGNYKKLPLKYSLDQLKYFYKRKIYNIAFYDDALLIDPDNFLNFLKEANYVSSCFNFYLPNAIHIAKTSKEIIMKMSNFKMIRFGLESMNPEDDKYGSKFSIEQLKNLIINLNQSKIPKSAVSFYILVGLPGQTYDEVENTIKVALSLGIKPRIAEYSPIPGTPIFQKAKEELIKNKKEYVDLEEPLFHNPSIYPYIATEFNPENMKKLKKLIY